MTSEELRWQRAEAQDKDIQAIIRRDFTASRMNTTRWREVAEALADLSVQSRIKFVDVTDKVFDLGHFRYVTGDWFDSGSIGTFTSVSIEWLNINTVEQIRQGALLKPKCIDHADKIERRLQAISVPYHWEDGCIRIIGHVSSATPEPLNK